MSLFEELAELFLKVQPTDDEPSQWIYAVDDAWFHPLNSKVLIKDKENDPAKLCEPVFDFDLAGKNENIASDVFTPSAPTVPLAGSGLSTLGQAGRVPTHTSTPDFSERMKSLLYRTGADRDVVAELFRFILDQEKNGNRYGVCFCSFEWFWRNVSEIDSPQNAVFFDIRHLLGKAGSVIKRAELELDVGQLRDDWGTALIDTDLFSRVPKPAHMERLGWYLHYCLKFAKVPGQQGHRPAITDNHIQIVSSAVNPGSGRADALSDYSEVQQFIWEKLVLLDSNTVANITPDRNGTVLSENPGFSAMRRFFVFRPRFGQVAVTFRSLFLRPRLVAEGSELDHFLSNHFYRRCPDLANLHHMFLPAEIACRVRHDSIERSLETHHPEIFSRRMTCFLTA